MSEEKSISIANKDQGLSFSDHTQLISFIKQMIQAKALPKHLTGVADVISAWNFAAQLKLPPQPSLRNIAIIQGTPSLFGDLPLALVQRHPDFMYYEEFTFDKNYKQISFENKNLDEEIFGGLVLLQRNGMVKPQSFSFTMKDAQRAGLLGRNGPWKTYPQVMITRRARIIAIRALFADALSGALIAEDFGFAPDLHQTRTVSDISETEVFNERYGENAIKEETNQGPENAREVSGEALSDMQDAEPTMPHS